MFRPGFLFLPLPGTSVIYMFASRNNTCVQVKLPSAMLEGINHQARGDDTS
ncbi:hypothetical protein J2S64_002835 [Paeniglutamicibacter sulfureus]|uniref:Uncharacterized protein n=1 Tax=Paeniglutamicibacter sulfureus TaxID=43666 RepID=A0ABU2BMF8_9MICC|nr:hypothetical protein [Paeniglutamicibacter sulfureus]